MRKTSAFLLTIALIQLAGCGKKEEKEKEPVVPVMIATVRQDSIRRLVLADAVLYPQDQASIVPKITAPVQKFLVNRGDHVREGQLLAVMENRDLAAGAAESKQLYEQAVANYRTTEKMTVPEETAKSEVELRTARQALDAAQKLLDSRQELYKQQAIARRQVDEAQVAYDQARGQFETAQEHAKAFGAVGKTEQVKAAQAQMEAAKSHQQGADAQLSYSEIRSPINGVIADRPLYAGETPAAGLPLLTVMDISRVVARANIPQNDAAALKVGDDATITQTGNSEEIPGKVIVVSPAADPNTTTVQVWVRADNKGERLKPGASVHLSIVAATIPDALVVPPEALLSGSEGGDAVMVIGAESTAREHKVQVGAREADKVQLLSGVSPGDQVVTVGGVGLQDGAKVRIMQPGENSSGGKEGKEDEDEDEDK